MWFPNRCHSAIARRINVGAGSTCGTWLKSVGIYRCFGKEILELQQKHQGAISVRPSATTKA